MRQVARRLKDGSLQVVDVPDPVPARANVLVRVEASVLSSGTERATLDVARKSLLTKARKRPDQVKQVLDRARTEGVRSTIELVRRRLEELGPLGYSAAGTAIEVGAEVRGIRPGQRVAIAGGGFANHAELDIVPGLLCAPIPDDVSTEDAAFATLGAIAMQGFRRSEAAVGSTVAVIGLGLIGQLAVRIALGAGCRVVGIDLDGENVKLAREAGAECVLRTDLEEGADLDGAADAVLICASAPSSSDPVELAGRLARDRAPVVVVGDVAMALPRPSFYGKELDLRLSRSYGPGRYDSDYELHGRDYPIGYVRWTEQRNMESFLRLVETGALRPGDLISHRFGIEEAESAFDALTGGERTVAIVLGYGDGGDPTPAPGVTVGSDRAPAPGGWRAAAGAAPRYGLIGAGGFATATIVPGLAKAGFAPVAVASASGLSAEDVRARFGFERSVSGVEEVLAAEDLDLIVIATPHDSHATLAAAALRRGIAVYVEKPLALAEEGLAAVRDAQLESGAPVVVGFNRTHSPLARELAALPGPRAMSYRVNAGRLPADHWTNDPERGGGRLLGEGCHFIDFLCDQAGGDPVTVRALGFPSDPRLARVATDNLQVQIEFSDGSVGTLSYAADSPKGPGKERFETSAAGSYAELDDFKKATIWTSDGGTRNLGGRGQDKGFDAQYASLAAILRGEAEPPPPERYLLSSLATIAAARSLESGLAEPVVETLSPSSG